MPHPKKRRTTSDKGMRRSHHALKEATVSVCKNCGSAVKPHFACPECGFYDGKKVLGKSEAPKVTETKKETKKEAEKKSENIEKKEEKK